MIRNKERGVNFIIQEKREHEIKEICDNFFFTSLETPPFN